MISSEEIFGDSLQTFGDSEKNCMTTLGGIIVPLFN
jgi:hypothetical protein